MSSRREIEARLDLYGDLSGILGAMRSFALAELQRITKREAAQQHLVGALSETLTDMASALPQSGTSNQDVWLLIGSVRGFCGSFNEDVVRAWREADGSKPATIAVGERLANLLPQNTQWVAGAEGGLDAASAIDRILEALNAARTQDSGLMVCIRDEAGARTQRLLPLPAAGTPTPGYLPHTYEASSTVASGVAEHYLFHALLALLLRSIRVENHMRLLQMENALRHLDDGRDDLQRLRNRMRQEEIVEEIELMAGRRH